MSARIPDRRLRVTLRPMLPSDVEALVHLERACFPDAWSFEQVASEIRHPASLALLATIGANPLGYLLARAGSPDVEILRLGVDPEHRRSGIGSSLVREALGRVAAAGAERIFLEMRAGNRGALSFYERLGFEKVGRRSGYYRDGEDAILCSRFVGSRTPPGG